jgi:hypothetical protein
MRLLLVLSISLAASRTASADESLESCPYLPLKVGTAWQYKTSGLSSVTILKKVARHGMLNGKPCAFTEVTAPDGGKIVPLLWLRDYSVDKDGVCVEALLGDRCDPGVRVLKLPFKAGETWKVSNKLRDFNELHEFTSGQEEEIEVPAGKFKAIPVKSINWYEGDTDDDKLERVEWFVKGVGIVKGIQKYKGMHNTIELEKYTAAK